MSGEIAVTKDYAPAKERLTTLRDNMNTSVHSGGVDARTTLTAALQKDASGSPSQAVVISLLRQIAAAANKHHLAGEQGMNAGLTSINGWKTKVIGTDEAGAEGIAGVLPVTPPEGSQAQPADPSDSIFVGIPGVPTEKRLGK
ncbi:MAG: hypothetical protein H6523_13100 [Mycolicibacterium sp.]|nr:hypothetical protein [Mycolicibacterium sp.]